MIPRSFLAKWRKTAPWQSDHMVEQDLVLSRCILELFSDELLAERLAFRGGTALHKLFISPASRYSEDIDLVHRTSQGIGDVFDRLRARLAFLGNPKTRRSDMMNTVIFRFESEIPPVVQSRVKIEINCREPFAVFGYRKIPFSVDSLWFKQTGQIITFSVEELLATKMRALYQRKKGRDLFDLYIGLERDGIDIDLVVQAFKAYLTKQNMVVSGKMFISNLSKKMIDPEFIGDTKGLLRPDIEYDHRRAWEKIQDILLSKL